ncbi:hypothetical protein LTR99_009638 [Exophiala xenobiotica]|uniref:Uncharacterized protein n=1 Tax=Vermiconidia calcicola TaxID=1690605 RepID=A0AAV9PWE7_9PEZI|nr:hypothetical protein LTR96_001738 [Exophiala xenobiotica]KAK5530476.1 hypothetical protein LTR25_009054 [Vermiconidia calcicola]KAK5539083.1 hypothetical protein LTR23_006897 [Chaetothyriales sp. CCFEE 6169]KAK5294240.1 hypothetical protein LTR99_009638 [Exophiala xenobiotica]KAK5336133.1 hypothetical protein LTR98_007463 [Exophiala xenobiotica]
MSSSTTPNLTGSHGISPLPPVPARQPLPLQNPSCETTPQGRVFVLRLNDPNLTVEHLQGFHWHQRDRLIVRIIPSNDSADPDKLPMVNWENRHTYMTPLVNRSKVVGEALGRILGPYIDAGFMTLDGRPVYKAIPAWRLDQVAEILAAFKWINPESVQRCIIGTRVFWPYVSLSQLAVRMAESWHDQLRSQSPTHPTPAQVAEYIWRCCHGVLHVSHSTGVVPAIPHEAQKTWDCLGIQLLREVYCVDKLHGAIHDPETVNPVEDRRARPPIDDLYSGADMRIRDDEEDSLYTRATAPTTTLAGDIIVEGAQNGDA